MTWFYCESQGLTMQGTVRKTAERRPKSKDRSTKEDLPPSTRLADEKSKKPTNSATPRSSNVTPRNYVLKSTAADIYSQSKKKLTTAPLKAPKKPTNKTAALSKSSPTKDVLKPSPSVRRTTNSESKVTTPVLKKKPSVPAANAAKPNTGLGPINVTVNSPPVKRKLILTDEARDQDTMDGGAVARRRQKTRTLHDNEVKILTTETVDNNTEMMRLSKSLKAKPKTFFVDLGDGDKRKPKPPPPLKSSEDEVSYEDDFESYESDFESYHSGSGSGRESDSAGGDSHSADEVDNHSDTVGEKSGALGSRSGALGGRSGALGSHSGALGSHSGALGSRPGVVGSRSGGDDVGSSSDDVRSSSGDAEQRGCDSGEERSRRDEERMLDSGSYELRESQKSAGRRALLDNIHEDRESGPFPAPQGPPSAPREGPPKASFTDEGFQEMVNGGRPVTRVEVLDRPLFIDFTKSKETKRKRRYGEGLRRRAADLLGMITLHEMSYTLLDMKPIPYELYMSTFGRSNHVQTAVQTYDDNVHEEVQTEEVFFSQKWTQCPVRFSDKDVCLTDTLERRRPLNSDEDYLKKFTFLLTSKGVDAKREGDVTKEYLRNPLRIYFEQKDGVGADAMLPAEEYEARLGNASFSVARLKKFLKKVEGRMTSVLAKNAGSSPVGLEKPSDVPSSKGYTTLDYKNVPDFGCLKHRKLTEMVFSETRSNLLMTVHRKVSEQVSMETDLVCLWDINVASAKPLKVLVAIDCITLCRYRGNTDGIFVSALEDGSIHLWDLSEEATILKAAENPPLTEINTEGLSKTAIDREWNAKNRNAEVETPLPLLQACAYTSSAANLKEMETTDDIVGLELLGCDHRLSSQDGGRKILGQVCSLQRIGIITIWMIVQERKTLANDLGKAFWSKTKLEKNQSIRLSDYVDMPTKERVEYNFNLTAAKRRLSAKKQVRKDLSRPKSSVSVSSDRPGSAANLRSEKTPTNRTENKMADRWESGILCTDLKVCKYNRVDHYLVAKSGGEVLLCTRVSGVVKVSRFVVTTDRATVTALATSPLGLPHFLAASDAGAVALCSLAEMRVLLTLDCRNTSPSQTASVKYQNDLRGRYIGTLPVKPGPAGVDSGHGDFSRCPIRSLEWPAFDPCSFTAVTAAGAGSAWQLARSDIHAAPTLARDRSALAGSVTALLTEGELQIHRLKTPAGDHRQLFLKYVALL